MYAAGSFAGDEQARQFRRTVKLEFATAHHVMGGRNNFDIAGYQIKSDIGTALYHTLKALAHFLRVQMFHGDIKPPIWAAIASAYFFIHGSGNNIPGGTFLPFVILMHEPFAIAPQQVSAITAQTLFNYCTGYPRVPPSHQTGGMKLHHFHIPQR